MIWNLPESLTPKLVPGFPGVILDEARCATWAEIIETAAGRRPGFSFALIKLAIEMLADLMVRNSPRLDAASKGVSNCASADRRDLLADSRPVSEK